VICDPACGTCGFLVAAGEYLRDNHPKLFQEKASRDHFHEEMFHGFDFDGTMLRIGSMNMTLHGVENPDIRYKDSLAQEHAGDEDRYSLVLANPPFAGSLDYETTAKDLLAVVKTKKTELLFMALFLKLLKPGGRAAVIVPDGVLFGSSTAHKEIRRMLVEDHGLDGIVKLPSGVCSDRSDCTSWQNCRRELGRHKRHQEFSCQARISASTSCKIAANWPRMRAVSLCLTSATIWCRPSSPGGGGAISASTQSRTSSSASRINRAAEEPHYLLGPRELLWNRHTKRL
jgi:hypothetical protein